MKNIYIEYKKNYLNHKGGAQKFGEEHSDEAHENIGLIISHGSLISEEKMK